MYELFRNNNLHYLLPVSYTHLDVYKRQAISGIILIRYAANVIGTLLKLLPDTIWTINEITNIAIVTIQPSTNTANDFDVITLNLVSGLKSEAFILSSCTSLANKSVTAINIIDVYKRQVYVFMVFTKSCLYSRWRLYTLPVFQRRKTALQIILNHAHKVIHKRQCQKSQQMRYKHTLRTIKHIAVIFHTEYYKYGWRRHCGLQYDNRRNRCV